MPKQSIPLREQHTMSLGCPCQGHYIVFLEYLEPAGTQEPFTPARSSLWKMQEGTHSDEEQTGARPTTEWWQVEDQVRAGCAGWPWSASVLLRTAGHSPRQKHQTGQPRRQKHQESKLRQRLILTRLSQEFHYWTTYVDIAGDSLQAGQDTRTIFQCGPSV